MAQNKFHHESIYRGADYLEKLKKYKLTICGAGAIGSNLADNLVRCGVSNIKVIDFDRIENHNIGSQIYGDMDVGALKVDALKNKIFRHVGAEIEAVNKKLTADNAKILLKGVDLVIDAFDNSASRQLIQDEVRLRKLNCLHCGVSDSYGEVVWDGAYKVPKDVEGDVCDYPLARNIVGLVVTIASEEILDFCLAKKPRLSSWSVTLKDFAIRTYK